MSFQLCNSIDTNEFQHFKEIEIKGRAMLEMMDV
jgi:hypothetical protein